MLSKLKIRLQTLVDRRTSWHVCWYSGLISILSHMGARLHGLNLNSASKGYISRCYFELHSLCCIGVITVYDGDDNEEEVNVDVECAEQEQPLNLGNQQRPSLT